MRHALPIGLAAAIAAPTVATAGTIEGTIYADLDENDLLSDPDEPIAGAVVYWESEVAAVTDDRGRYTLEAPRPGIVWVRTPGEYGPGPVWKLETTGEDATVDLGLEPREDAPGPLRFIVASDSHVGADGLTANDLMSSLEQSVAFPDPPAFIAITGDMTQSNQPDQFRALADALDDLPTPFVPVPGNHDWYDGGVTYRMTYGPPSYSFDMAGTHFVVINDAASVGSRKAFVELDMSRVSDSRMTVAFTHAPPPDELISTLSSAGVDYLFSGHLHSNRILDHDGLVEYNTQPISMGGIDTTPAGYRVVTRRGAFLEVQSRTVVQDAVVEIVSPGPDEPVAGCEANVHVTAEYGAGPARVTATAGGGEVELEQVGDWGYRGLVPGFCDTANPTLEVAVEFASGWLETRTRQVRTEPVDVSEVGELTGWPQLQGGPAHTGARSDALAPPLTTMWTAHVGATLHGGSPVVADGTVYVPVADFGDGTTGGVVALDARTGARKWRYFAGYGVRSAPAVSGGIVAVNRLDGAVVGLDARTGQVVWEHRLAEAAPEQMRSLYASPTIAGGRVVAGIQREVVALDVDTGEPVWSDVPLPTKGWFGSYATPAVRDDVVTASFSGGGQGLFAWSAAAGTAAWQSPGRVTTGMHASPVMGADTAYTITWETDLYAVDSRTGEPRWSRRLSEEGFTWGYGVVATPALAGGTLFVPSQHDHLYALDADSGDERWRYEAEGGLIRPAHYRGQVGSFAASPVVTGDILWVGGTDGTLSALATSTGEKLWSRDLGVPVMMGPAPSGNMLFVGTYDGTVRALRGSVENAASPADAKANGCRAGPGDGGAWPLALVALAGLRRRGRGARLSPRAPAPCS